MLATAWYEHGRRPGNSLVRKWVPSTALAWCRAGYRPIRLWAPCWPQPWLLTGSVLATAWCEYRYLAGHSLAVDWCLGGYGLVRAWVPSWPQPGSGQAPCCASYSLVQVWVLCWRRPGTSMGTVLATEHGGWPALCWLQPCTRRLPCWPWCTGAVLAAGYRAGHRLVRAWLPSWPQPEWTCAPCCLQGIVMATDW